MRPLLFMISISVTALGCSASTGFQGGDASVVPADAPRGDSSTTDRAPEDVTQPLAEPTGLWTCPIDSLDGGVVSLMMRVTPWERGVIVTFESTPGSVPPFPLVALGDRWQLESPVRYSVLVGTTVTVEEATLRWEAPSLRFVVVSSAIGEAGPLPRQQTSMLCSRVTP